MQFYQEKNIELSSTDVLLSGGYSGHANFGDILQLKSVISWYKEQGREVVVIIRLDAIYDDEFMLKLYEWFDVKAFIFYAEYPWDVSTYHLEEVADYSFSNFHLYGGGMINTFWAELIISLCENIIKTFDVKNYVISGQQIDEHGASLLQEHFKTYIPSIVGVRDRESLQYLEAKGIEAFYSFDDAFESLLGLKKGFILEEMQEQEVYLHFNLSPYVSDDLLGMIDEFNSSLALLKEKYPKAKYKLLLTYLDSRIFTIIDTLGVIGSLDYHFDMDDVLVLNLASMSLKEGIERQLNLDKNAIALATSYHTAMFMQILGFKVFMYAGNDYYEQKRRGLGLESHTLQNFVAGQNETDLNEQRREDRRSWLAKLAIAMDKKMLCFESSQVKESLPLVGRYQHKQKDTNIGAAIESILQRNKRRNKVFGIGWAKTGTTSLGKVLSILGYKHKPQDFQLVDELMQGQYSGIEHNVMEHDSFDDWPWIIIYKQLDAMFENSKFVLTVRDTDAWIKSYRNMLKNEGEASEHTNMMRSFLYGIDFPHVSDEALVARYKYHIQEVKAYFKHRPNDLLIVDWSKGSGWKEVCDFLGKDIPNEEFPHSNKGTYR